MKKIIILITLTILSSFLFADYDLSLLGLTKGVKEYQLKNGLTVIIKEENSVPLVGLSVNYKVGFRNETNAGKTGLTHLLEHMMFKGTKNFKKGEIAKTLDDAGARFNAYTVYDKTSYWEILPRGGFETAVRLEADRMQNALLDPQEFESEKKVVLSEISRYETNPSTHLERKLFTAAMGSHPYASIYGQLEDVAGASRDYVYNELYKKYYCPNNAYIVVVGDVHADDALKMIEQYFGGIPANPALPKDAANFFTVRTGSLVTVEGVASENFGTTLYRLPGWNISDKEFAALTFISRAGVLGNFYYQITPDGGVGFSSFTSEPSYAAETIDTNYIVRNFTNFVKKLYNRELMGYDTINSIMNSLVYYERYGSIHDYDRMAAAMTALTPEDLISVIRKYLNRGNSLSGLFIASKKDPNFKPESTGQTVESFGKDIDFSGLENPTKDEIEKSRKAGQALFSDAKTSITAFMSDITETRLPNGLTVIVKPYHLGRKVTMTAGFRMPFYAQKKPKQNSLTHDFIFDGGPFIKLRNELELSGVRFGGGAEMNFMEASATAPLPLFGKLLDYLALAVKDRSFNPVILEEYKFNAIQVLLDRKRDPDPSGHAEEDLYSRLFGKTGAGLDYNMKPEDILSIKLKDIEDYYRAFIRPENTVIIVVGDLDPNEAVQKVKEALGSWKQAPSPFIPAEVAVAKPDQNIESRIKIPSRQSIVVMAAPSTPYEDPTNHLALVIANQIFGGGGLTSRIERNIRDQHGLTYSVNTSIFTYGNRDIFSFSMQNDPKDIVQALSLYREELAKYKKAGPNDLELEKTKNKILSGIFFGYETGESIASQLLYSRIMRGAYNNDEKFIGILNGLDHNKIMKAVAEGFPDKYFITIAGE